MFFAPIPPVKEPALRFFSASLFLTLVLYLACACRMYGGFAIMFRALRNFFFCDWKPILFHGLPFTFPSPLPSLRLSWRKWWRPFPGFFPQPTVFCFPRFHSVSPASGASVLPDHPWLE